MMKRVIYLNHEWIDPPDLDDYDEEPVEVEEEPYEPDPSDLAREAREMRWMEESNGWGAIDELRI